MLTAPPANPHSQIPNPQSSLPSPSLVFDPPPEKIPELLSRLDSPFSSLQNVADANNTTLEALIAWMSRPDIADRNQSIDSAAATRNRSLATRNLRRAIAALSLTLENATQEEREQHASDSPRASLARTRNREYIAKASRLLLQFARHDPPPSSPPTSPPPTSSSPDRAQPADELAAWSITATRAVGVLAQPPLQERSIPRPRHRRASPRPPPPRRDRAAAPDRR